MRWPLRLTLALPLGVLFGYALVWATHVREIAVLGGMGGGLLGVILADFVEDLCGG